MEAASGASDDDRKGPVTATCPAGGPGGAAEAFAAIETPRRLVVTVVCANGGR